MAREKRTGLTRAMFNGWPFKSSRAMRARGVARTTSRMGSVSTTGYASALPPNMALRRVRGFLLRIVRRRRLALVLGLALALPAGWVEFSGRYGAWWVEGLALRHRGDRLAIFWTGLTGASRIGSMTGLRSARPRCPRAERTVSRATAAPRVSSAKAFALHDSRGLQNTTAPAAVDLRDVARGRPPDGVVGGRSAADSRLRRVLSRTIGFGGREQQFVAVAVVRKDRRADADRRGRYSGPCLEMYAVDARCSSSRFRSASSPCSPRTTMNSSPA